MLNKNDRKEIAGKLKALFPKASDSGREQLLNLLINCCCIDLCSISNQADDIQFTGLTLLGNTLSLTLTINGTPTTQVVNLPTQISTTLVTNGDGTFTYTNESNVVTTIDVATLLVDAGISDGFVNNNDGTLTHAAIDGTVVTFDINDLLLTTTPLFTVNAGTTSVSTDASLGSQVITYGDILHFWSNGSLNFNVQAGSVVVGIDTEADIIPYTPTTLASTNVGDALDELAANSHNPTTLTNTAAPFSWNVSTQAGNIPLTPTLTDNGDGTITYNPNNGVAPITIDTRENSTEVVTTAPITINGTLYPIGTSVQTVLTALTAASHLATTVDVTSNPALTVNLATQAIKLDLDVNGSYNNSGTTLVATSVQDAITELAATSHPLTILTNNAAPFSWNTTTQAGNIPVSPTLVNNGNGTITFTSGTGTAPVTIDVTEDASEVLTTTSITINGTTYPANTAVETILSAISTYAGTTNLTYTPSATNGTIVSDTGTDAVIPSVTLTDAGLATPAMLTNSHVPVSSINSSITIVQSGVNSQTLKADITGIATATSGQVASTDGAGNIVWTTPSSGVTDLTYTPSATNGIVVSSTGTDATISAVDNTNAGLATPAMLLNSHVPATFNDSGTIDFTVSGTDNQTVTATLLGISGATIGQVPQSDGAGNITWVTLSSAITATDSDTVDFTVTGSDITGSVKLDTANGGITATVNGLLFNADGLATYSNSTSGLVSTTLQDALDELAAREEWHTTGNVGTDGGVTNFLGTTDAQDLVLKTNNTEIARFGQQGNAAFGSNLTNIAPSLIAPFASNIGSIAFQSGQATGLLSTAFHLAIASGDGSMAWGTAEGSQQPTTASGGSSTAWGVSTTASGDYSTAFGNHTVASGINSLAFGRGNIAPSFIETTIGAHATNYTPISSFNFNVLDRLFTIGNGLTSLTRNNALTMWKNGKSMWNGDVEKTNTWIGVNGTDAQNFINVTTPTGNLAAISTEHTTSGNYAVLGSNNGNSGLVINNTKQFAFTTTAGTTSTQLGATSTIGNYSSTGFLFGSGGVATSTVDVNGSFATNILSDNTAALTLTNNHRTVINTGAATTYTLPVASTCRGREYVIVNHGTGNITFSTAVRVANGVTITTLSNTAGTNTITMQSDGATWVKTND